MGAKETSYDMNLRKFYFLAVAHRFVANKTEFHVAALAPLLTISVVLISFIFFAGHSWTIALLTTLMIHGSFCSGDFALLNYFQVNNDQEVVTYNDKENNVSFFYGRAK